jgi:hypothetical protein
MPRNRNYTPADVLDILRASEGIGPGAGHAIARHVNISNPNLIRRVDEDTRNGGVANYGAFREYNLTDAALMGAWLLNSPAGAILLGTMDQEIEDVRQRGRPLQPDDYPRNTVTGRAPGGWLMRWVQAGSMVIEVPVGELTMVLRGDRGGEIEIVTFYPVFTGGRNIPMRVLYRAR